MCFKKGIIAEVPPPLDSFNPYLYIFIKPIFPDTSRFSQPKSAFGTADDKMQEILEPASPSQGDDGGNSDGDHDGVHLCFNATAWHFLGKDEARKVNFGS